MADNRDKRNFLGWDIEFTLEDGTRYDLQIEKVTLGFDVGSCIPGVVIHYLIDSIHHKFLLKHHTGTLKITNKTLFTNTPSEIFKIKLQSVCQVGTQNIRESTNKNDQYSTVRIPIKYMCDYSIQLMNCRVGGVFNKKSLDKVIKETYQNTKCKLTLRLDEIDNKKIFEQVFVPEGSFLNMCKLLNQNYGLYKDMLIMNVDSFVSTGDPKFVISSANKFKGDVINLHYIPTDDRSDQPLKEIASKNYYTFTPIDTTNMFARVSNKVPKKINCISLDNTNFYTSKKVETKQIIGGLNYIKTKDQFDKQMTIEEETVVVPRSETGEYAINDSVTKFASSAITPSELTIPNPFLMEHWKIGNIINYKSNHEKYMDFDIKFIILGVLYTFSQTGENSQAGCMWEADLKVKIGAVSTVHM